MLFPSTESTRHTAVSEHSLRTPCISHQNPSKQSLPFIGYLKWKALLSSSSEMNHFHAMAKPKCGSKGGRNTFYRLLKVNSSCSKVRFSAEATPGPHQVHRFLP